MSNFIKIRPVGVELFHEDGQTHEHMDGQTGLTKQIVAFRNFASAPNNRQRFAH